MQLALVKTFSCDIWVCKFDRKYKHVKLDVAIECSTDTDCIWVYHVLLLGLLVSFYV